MLWEGHMAGPEGANSDLRAVVHQPLARKQESQPYKYKELNFANHLAECGGKP